MTLFNKKYASLYDDINSGKKYMIIGRRFLKILMISAAVAAAFACKKDDGEEEALPSLGGMVKFSLDPYMEVNSTFRVEPSGIYHPEGKGFGYYCKASWKESNDTIKLENSDSFIEEKMLFTFPEDSVGTFTISCTAFASGYYSTSVSRYVTTVSRESSLIDTLLGYDATAYPAGEVIDNRDGEGRTYRTVRIGNAEWFAENLAYKGLDHASGDNQGKAVFGIPYQNCEAMSDIFGRYYTWNEAMGLDKDGNPSGVKLCPDGWTVPTDEDWKNLAAELADDPSVMEAGKIFPGIAGKIMVEAKFNSEDNEMWEYWPAVKITNETGMSVIPCGFANISGTAGSFESAMTFAAFWTATEKDTDQAYIRYINCYEPDIFITSSPKVSFGAPVRCIKE